MSNEIPWWELYKPQIIYAIIYAFFTALFGALASIIYRKYEDLRKKNNRKHEENEKRKDERLESLNSLKRGVRKLIEIVKDDDYKGVDSNDYLPDSLIKIVSDNLIETLRELKIDFKELLEWYEVCRYIIHIEIKDMFERITPKFYENSKHHVTVFSDKFYKYYLNGKKVTKQLIEEKELKFYEDYFKKALELTEEINNLQFLINGLNEAFIMNGEVLKMNKYLVKYRDKKKAFIQMGECISLEISEIQNV